jgi:hypothetical protein
MRILLSLAALLLLATFAPLRLYRDPPVPDEARLWFDPVALDAPIGGLAFLGGWELRSNDRRFGGISAIHVEDGEVLALSDRGVLLGFDLPLRQGARIRIRPLREVPGNPEDKRDRDTEAMAVRGDSIWVAFERSNSVWRYDRGTLRRAGSAAPEPMRDWFSNSGPEAMARLGGDRFLVVSERSRRGARFSEAVLFEGDPTRSSTRLAQIAIRRPQDYRVTDAARLPDGRILLLHRRFSYFEGVSAKLTSLDEKDLKPGGFASVSEVAHFPASLKLDNFEGLSVTREDGRTILWIATDDNFNAVQRTLLLKFALDD